MDRDIRNLLSALVDKYESSKTFIGENQKNQSFTVAMTKACPKYADDADYDTFFRINLEVGELEQKGLIAVKRKPNGVITHVSLQVERLEEVCGYLGRTPKREEHLWLRGILEGIRDLAPALLKTYAMEQIERLDRNKTVEFYGGNQQEFQDILRAASFALGNEAEAFIRNISMELFQDSKRLEQIQSKVQTLLYRYGDFGEREFVLEELGIVRTPTYVMMKGNGVVSIGKQSLRLCELCGDVGFSTKSLEEISGFQVLGNRVITIENLTTFHDYTKAEDFCIYLGGFHNQVKQKVLKRIHEQNPEKEYLHFGDIDAGGFCIYEHLRRKTKIDFHPVFMDVETLEKHQKFWAVLTEHDRTRLGKLLENPEFAVFYSVIEYMLEHDCKLEQEGIEAGDER